MRFPRPSSSLRQHSPALPGGHGKDAVYQKASLITPVPGGVGPCTIAMLLRNTVEAARGALERERLLRVTA